MGTTASCLPDTPPLPPEPTPPAAPTAPELPTIALVLIDDNRLTRAGLVALIRGQPGFRVHAASADIAEALQTVREIAPDIVVLNMGRADDDALTVAGALRGGSPGSRLIVMGLDAHEVDVESLVRAGVAGLVMATADLAEFLGAVQRVARDERVLPAALAGSLFRQLKRHGSHWRRKPVVGTARLTAREREVADLVVRGLSNAAIAGRLSIAVYTVKGHVHRVLTKLECNTRLEIAAFALQGTGRSPAGSPETAGHSLITERWDT